MKSRNLFLGLIILFVGVIALLSSLDIIEFRWSIVWRLWPMLLIFTGIMVLPLKDWLKAVLLVVALCISVLLYRYEDSRRGWPELFSQSEKSQVETTVKQV